MEITKSTTAFLNPTQIPVLIGDNPIYAHAKKVQILYPEEFGEDKFVVFPGGLHMEKAKLVVIGDVVEGMGWAEVIAEAGVATSEVANSMYHASHLTRTRHAHEEFILALHILKMKAWDQFQQRDVSLLSFIEWTEEMHNKSATFKFWDTYSKLVQLVLMFVRAHRTGDFALYMQTVKEMVPYFFALDHQNYARWTSIHIQDLYSLPEPILDEFSQGNFVVTKTKKRGSSIAFDQAHEQNNRVIKSSGGLIGLTGPSNEKTFKRWKILAPEMARILQDFKTQTFAPSVDDDEEQFHHQEGLASNQRFQTHVQNLVKVIESKGNPYLDDFPELVTLHTRKVLDPSVANSINSLEQVGKEGYEAFRKNVLVDRISSIDLTIKRNNLPLPKNPRIAVKSKEKGKVQYLLNNVALFGQLYLSNRESNQEEFFQHESLPHPPSITDNGKMYFSSKSDLLQCFLSNSDDNLVIPKTYDCVILDGAAIVHFLSPEKSVVTFLDYAKKRFIPHLEKILLTCDRIDIVFDRYLTASLKNSVREKRGSGTRYKVHAKGKVPSKWLDFL